MRAVGVKILKDKLSEYAYHETRRRPMIIPVLS